MSTVIQMPERRPWAARVLGNIKAELGRRDLKQAWLGEVLGKGQSSISDRWRGKMEFSFSEVEAIAEALEVPLSVLVGERVDSAPYPDGDGGSRASSSMAEQRTFNPKVVALRLTALTQADQSDLPHAA